MTDYSRGDYADLPAGTTDLENNYSAPDLTAIASNDNSTYAEQTANNEIAIHQYKKTVTSQYTNILWSGKSSLAPSESPVILEVYNVTGTPAWEELDRDDSTAADTDFDLSYDNLATADYLDTGVITWRVYQAASGEAPVTITLGDDIILNGTFTTDYTDWSAAQTPTLAVQSDGGNNALNITSDAVNVNSGVRQYLAPTLGWYRSEVKIHPTSGSWMAKIIGGSNNFITCQVAGYYGLSGPADKTSFRGAGFINDVTGIYYYLICSGAGAYVSYFDDVTLMPITGGLFRSPTDTSSSSVVVYASVTIPDSNAGVTLGISPAGVFACKSVDGTKYLIGVVVKDISGAGNYAKLYGINGDTITDLSPAGGAITYGDAKVIKIDKSGNTIKLYYDNVQIGTDYTDDGTYNGTIHGIFNTDDAITVDSLSVT